MQKKLLIVAAVFIVGVIVLASLPILQVPTWRVFVVDATGQPVSGVTVTETWQDYFCEREKHQIKALTDGRGQVSFPAIRSHRNPLKCAIESLSELSAGVHASLGRHARVDVDSMICVSDESGYCVDWTGSTREMASHVVLK